MQPIYTKQCYQKYKVLQQAARKLRKNQTLCETLLWQKIRGKQLSNIQFHRQQILLNSYIVDFYAHSIKLALEIDGAQHGLRENKELDIMRDRHLKANGITIKRYSNIIVLDNITFVLKDIQTYIAHTTNNTLHS